MPQPQLLSRQLATLSPLAVKRRSALFAALAFSFLLVLLSCSFYPSPQSSLDEASRTYLQIVVGLGERDPDSLDFYSGPEQLVREIRSHPPSLAELASRTAALQRQVQEIGVATADQRERKLFFLAQLEAILLRIHLLQGERPPFDTESRAFFGVVAGKDGDDGRRRKARAILSELLGGGASLAQRYEEFDQRFLVRRERLPAVMQQALQVCREETRKNIVLPSDEHVDVEYVTQKPWSAFSRYLGNARSRIQVNVDYPLTVDRVLNLACHEGYPGHHVWNLLRDRSLVQTKKRQEWSAQPTFSPQSFVSEAAASYAPYVAFSDEERLRIEKEILFPLAGLKPEDAQRYLLVQKNMEVLAAAEPSIAREYLDGRLEFARACNVLEREVLMAHPETLLLYLNEYRSYMLTYTVGKECMRQFLEAGTGNPEDRWSRFKTLMLNPVATLP